MKKNLRKILIQLHFTIISTVILNSIIHILTTYSLNENIEFTLKLIVSISGLFLFFIHLKPFKKINYYFSIYAVAGTLLLIGIIFRGIFGALLISIILFPIIPADKEYEKDGVELSIPFQGFMSPCCFYKITERQFLIIEKDFGNFRANGQIDTTTIKIKSTDSEIELTYSTDYESNEKVIKKK